MRARQCDRCGQFYRTDNEPKYKVTEISRTASKYSKSVDLCPECCESLAKWYEQMEKKDEQ